MYGKGLKHPETSVLVREGYKKFTLSDIKVIDLLSISNFSTDEKEKSKSKEVIDTLLLESIKQLVSKLERDLSVSNFDDKKPQLFNPLDVGDSSSFFEELIKGISLDDLYNEIVLSQQTNSSSNGSFNNKIWNAFVVEKLIPAIQGFRVLVLNQPMMNQDVVKKNISTLKLGQRMEKGDKNKLINRITDMITEVENEEFGVIKEGSLIDLRIKQLSQPGDNNLETLEKFMNMIDDIKNTLIEFAGSNLTIKALEWVDKTPTIAELEF